VIDGLPVHTLIEVVVDGRWEASAPTLAPLPGRELCRLATVSDLHVGDGWKFGVLPTLKDPGRDEDPVVERAATAAVAELTDWGAELLVAKGDLTHHGREDEFARAAGILTGTGLPVVATIGNHDVRKDHVDGRPVLAEAGIQLAVGGVVVRDVPGLRVVVADATIPRRHPGSFKAVGSAILEAVDGAGPALLAMHHQIQRGRLPSHWPPGVLGPESGHFIRQLSEANRNVVVTSGHTHRHRKRTVYGLPLTEVGSPKDHPGTWAGYVVHERGIRQVVRRTMAPEVLRWTEQTKRALFGVWGRWSTGSLGDRCFTHRWRGA
jgi:predicted phosphodiesterase